MTDARLETTGNTAVSARWGVPAGLIALVTAAAVISVAGFRAVFEDWSFLVAGAVGAIGASVMTAISWWRRLLIGESLAGSVLLFGIVGCVVVGPVPGPSSFSTLADGLQRGWAELLSIVPPTELTDELRVLPFTLAWFASLVGGELARRTKAPSFPIAGALVSFGVTVLVTAEDRSVAVTQGALLAVAALAIGVIQWNRTMPDAEIGHDETGDAAADAVVRSGGSWRTPARTLVALALVAGASVWLGPRLPLAEAEERFDLRDRTEPPWDPLSVGSPLARTKSYLITDRVDERMFTVRSDAQPGRFTLAVMGDFDGAVWSVGSTTGASAVEEFRAVGTRLPRTDVADDDELDRDVDVEVVIDQLTGPFVPVAGDPERLDVTDATGERAASLRYNLQTGTAAVPAGVGENDTVQLRTRLAPEPDDSELRLRRFGSALPVGDTDIVPLPVRNLAAELVEGIDVGWEQVEAIRDRFVDDGFYDRSDAARPGHSYFRLDEFLAEPDRLVGYEEQYAAAAALLGRIAEIPTRVAIGFLVPEERYEAGEADVFADDVSAWIEVDVVGVGWVPVDVSPDRSREPSVDASGATIEEVAVPAPPPPPPVPPTPEVLPSIEDDDEDDEDDEEDDEDEATVRSGAGLVPRLAVGGSAALLAVLLGAGGVALLKASRSKRRRRADQADVRVSGAWREVLDRSAEAGVRFENGATPGEVLRAMPDELVSDDARPTLRALAYTVQRSAYHAEPPEMPDAERAWAYHDELVGNVSGAMPRWRRVIARCDPRTLRSTQR